MAIPRGIPKEEFSRIQELKAEDDFKIDTAYQIGEIKICLSVLQESLSKAQGVISSNKAQIESQLSEILDGAMAAIKEVKKDLHAISNEIGLNRVRMSEIDYKLDSCAKEEDLRETIAGLHECIENFSFEREQIRADFQRYVNTLRSQYDTKLDDFKSEIMNIPSEIPEMTRLIDEKVQLVELNGQNSILRSANNEKQIMLLERKIENLSQVVKKIELTKQEEAL